jgi:hypothetical protein
LKVIKNEQGDLEVEISFDITTHGHFLGEKRNYDIDTITKLINNSITQHHIEVGMCLGYLGHSGRNYKNNPHIAKELNTKGEKVEPCLRTLALSIDGNIITHKQLIVTTEQGLKVAKFGNSGIGGFSFAWNDEIFAGADYVFSPNFVENRIIQGSICQGECDIYSLAKKLVTDEISEDDEVLEFIQDSETFEFIKTIQTNTQNELELKLDSVLELNRGLHRETLEYRSELAKLKDMLYNQGFAYDGKNINLRKDAVAGLIRLSSKSEYGDIALLDGMIKDKPTTNKMVDLSSVNFW